MQEILYISKISILTPWHTIRSFYIYGYTCDNLDHIKCLICNDGHAPLAAGLVIIIWVLRAAWFCVKHWRCYKAAVFCVLWNITYTCRLNPSWKWLKLCVLYIYISVYFEQVQHRKVLMLRHFTCTFTGWYLLALKKFVK